MRGRTPLNPWVWGSTSVNPCYFQKVILRAYPKPLNGWMECGWSFVDCIAKNDTAVLEDYTPLNLWEWGSTSANPCYFQKVILWACPKPLNGWMECGWSFADYIARNDTAVLEDKSCTGVMPESCQPGPNLNLWYTPGWRGIIIITKVDSSAWHCVSKLSLMLLLVGTLSKSQENGAAVDFRKFHLSTLNITRIKVAFFLEKRNEKL